MLMNIEKELPPSKNVAFEAEEDPRKTLQREANQSTITDKVNAIHAMSNSLLK